MTENEENAEVQSVGELLHNARVKQGKTIAEVAEDLCIRKFYLNAIENMDLDNIPPAPYGIGFIHSYAQYLGLNSERIVSSYRQNLLLENLDNNTKHEHPSSGAPKLRHIFLGFCGFAILVSAWKMWPQIAPLEDFSSQEETIVAEPEIVIDSKPGPSDIAPITAETTAEDTTDNEIAAPAEAQIVNHIKIELAGPSWLELKNGDKVLLNGIYNKGYVYEEVLETGSYISVGRPNNVKIYINNELTKVASSLKKANIALDDFIAENN